MYQFGVGESKFLRHAFNISPLVNGNSPGNSITFDFKAKEPVEFTKVCDVIVTAEFGLEWLTMGMEFPVTAILLVVTTTITCSPDLSFQKGQR